jgi:hypothetical protein
VLTAGPGNQQLSTSPLTSASNLKRDNKPSADALRVEYR